MAYNIISRQQRRLREKGLTEEQARWIAYKTQLAKGNTKGRSFQLSEEGKTYSQLGPIEREILRRSRKSGRPPSDYTVRANKVVLKK